MDHDDEHQQIFGEIRIDRRRFQVLRDGRPVALEPKAFDLLTLLVDHRDRVVTKQEIFDHVWPGTAVTDNALTRAVAQLRKALGDAARDAKYIETVPTRGYRWIAAPAPPTVVRERARSAAGATAALALCLATLALVLWMRVLPRVPSRITLQPVQLTTSAGLNAFPAFSPDNASIAYASDRNGSFEIIVRGLASSAIERSITSDGGQNVQPVWSPDAKSIAYHSRARGGIWIVDAAGGVPRQVSPFGSKPSWSADSRRLAFQSDPCVDISPVGRSANIPSTIWIVDRDGTHARALTPPGAPAGAHGAPSWSHDGRHVVFATYGARSAFWTIASEGGAPHQIAGTSGLLDPVFASDDRHLYGSTGGRHLARIALTSEATDAAGPLEKIGVGSVDATRHAVLSADGRAVAMTSMALDSRLFSIPVVDGAAVGMPSPVTDDRTLRQGEPAFSPDGASIAFWSSRPGAGSEIWMVAASGGRATPIAMGELFAPRAFTRPTWVGGGREIAFLAHGSDAVRAVKTDLESRRQTTLLEMDGAAGARDLAVAPDGARVAYSALDPRSNRPRVYVRDVSASLGALGDARPLTTGAFAERFPIWSPDGATIAFELKRSDATEIAVVPADGGEARTITANGGENWPYGWSPDGDRLVYARFQSGVWNLWWVSIRSGETRRLTDYASANTFVRYPSWSPRGDRIAYELGTVTGNIWVAKLIE